MPLSSLTLRFYYDPDSQLSIEKIQQQSPLGITAWDQWREVTPDTIQAYEMKPCWFIVTLRNDSNTSREVMLDYPFPRIPYLDAYVFKGGQLINEYETGQLRAAEQRAVHNTGFAFPLVLEPGEEVSVVLRSVKWSHKIPDDIRVVAQSDYYKEAQVWFNINFLLFGVLITLAFYNCLVYLYTRDKLLILFAGYVFTILLSNSSTAGYWSLYFPVSDLEAMDHVIHFSWAMNILMAIYFPCYFLEMEKFHPRANKWLLASGWFSFLVIVLALIDGLTSKSIIPLFLIFSYAAIIPVLMALSVFNKNRSHAVLLLLSVLPFVILETIQKMNRSGMTDIPTLGMSELAQVLQCFILSYALGERISIMQSERQKAAADSKAKSDFMALMSHEIRTPMNAVLGMSELLKKTPLDEKQASYNNVIYSAGSALLTIINDILDYSKITAGKMKIDPVVFNIRSLAQEVIDMFEGQAREKNIAVTVHVGENVPTRLKCDISRLRQILVNLVGNAVKFTDSGSVTLSVTEDPKREDNILFRINDSGAGITKDKQGSLFQDYMQADESVFHQYGGTGLGLSISKKLVLLMGGEIGVESEPEKGSCFWFSLPLLSASAISLVAKKDGAGEADEDDVVSCTSKKGLSVLVADDNNFNQMVVRGMLENLGHRCKLTGTGLEALNAYKSEAEAYDLILMDCDMPEMDGWEATRALRKWEQDQQKNSVAVVALTAHYLPEQLKKCRQAGMTGQLTKPINMASLAQAIDGQMAG